MHSGFYFSANKIDVAAKDLVLLFWVAVFLLCVLLLNVRQDPVVVVVTAILAGAILAPTVSAVLAWTAWLTSGFAP